MLSARTWKMCWTTQAVCTGAASFIAKRRDYFQRSGNNVDQSQDLLGHEPGLTRIEKKVQFNSDYRACEISGLASHSFCTVRRSTAISLEAGFRPAGCPAPVCNLLAAVASVGFISGPAHLLKNYTITVYNSTLLTVTDKNII